MLQMRVGFWVELYNHYAGAVSEQCSYLYCIDLNPEAHKG